MKAVTIASIIAAIASSISLIYRWTITSPSPAYRHFANGNIAILRAAVWSAGWHGRNTACRFC
jgi:hypothetical protein